MPRSRRARFRGPADRDRTFVREGFRHHIRRFFGWVSPDRHHAGCGFRKETIAGVRRNGRDAPGSGHSAVPVANLLSRPKLILASREVRPLATLTQTSALQGPCLVVIDANCR
jgi:hypothetical protein